MLNDWHKKAFVVIVSCKLIFLRKPPFFAVFYVLPLWKLWKHFSLLLIFSSCALPHQFVLITGRRISTGCGWWESHSCKRSDFARRDAGTRPQSHPDEGSTQPFTVNSINTVYTMTLLQKYCSIKLILWVIDLPSELFKRSLNYSLKRK